MQEQTDVYVIMSSIGALIRGKKCTLGKLMLIISSLLCNKTHDAGHCLSVADVLVVLNKFNFSYDIFELYYR